MASGIRPSVQTCWTEKAKGCSAARFRRDPPPAEKAARRWFAFSPALARSARGALARRPGEAGALTAPQGRKVAGKHVHPLASYSRLPAGDAALSLHRPPGAPPSGDPGPWLLSKPDHGGGRFLVTCEHRTQGQRLTVLVRVRSESRAQSCRPAGLQTLDGMCGCGGVPCRGPGRPVPRRTSSHFLPFTLSQPPPHTRYPSVSSD